MKKSLQDWEYDLKFKDDVDYEVTTEHDFVSNYFISQYMCDSMGQILY